MNQQSVATSLAPEVVIGQVNGNLQVKGWDQPEVQIKASPDELHLEEQEDVVHFSCHGNCSVRVPHGAVIRVESVQGEGRFKLLEDQIAIQEVSGSLLLRGVAETRVEVVKGDVTARHVSGDLLAENVSGNFTARDVQGKCMAENVAGNLDLRDIEGSIRVQAKGNARVSLSLIGGDRYEVSASGNVTCRIPQDASARLHLTSRSQNIKVNLPGEVKSYQGEEVDLVLGSGESVIDISAGGVIYLSGQQSAWMEGEEPGEGYESFTSGFPTDLAQQIEAQIETQLEAVTRQINQQMENLSASINQAGLSPERTEEILRRARESSERASARAQEKMRRAQEKLERKLEAARKRQELKEQAMERRAQARSRGPRNFDWTSPASSPGKEPVSDEERLMILKMLEQKKITLEEAEELLAALEGRE